MADAARVEAILERYAGPIALFLTGGLTALFGAWLGTLNPDPLELTALIELLGLALMAIGLCAGIVILSLAQEPRNV